MFHHINKSGTFILALALWNSQILCAKARGFANISVKLCISGPLSPCIFVSVPFLMNTPKHKEVRQGHTKRIFTLKEFKGNSNLRRRTCRQDCKRCQASVLSDCQNSIATSKFYNMIVTQCSSMKLLKCLVVFHPRSARLMNLAFSIATE